MSKDKKEKGREVVSSGILDENSGRILEIKIPGRGTIKIEVNFEKEVEDYTKKSKKYKEDLIERGV